VRLRLSSEKVLEVPQELIGIRELKFLELPKVIAVIARASNHDLLAARQPSQSGAATGAGIPEDRHGMEAQFVRATSPRPEADCSFYDYLPLTCAPLPSQPITMIRVEATE